MRLVSLSANKESFHTIRFNQTGPTYIVGTRTQDDAGDAKRSVNGVGKSLIVALLHYCLGSNQNSAFQEHLSDWEFTLRIESDGQEHSIVRVVDNAGRPRFDGEEMSLTDLRSKLEAMCFQLPESHSPLSFRSLITRFARQGRKGYTDYDRPNSSDEKPFQRMLNLAFLLGLDFGLAVEKKDLRQRRKQAMEMRGKLEGDEVFKRFFRGDKNPDIELQDIQDQIQLLRVSLDVFQVAENYSDRQVEADAFSQSLQRLRNRQTSTSRAIDNIARSLQVGPELDPEQLRRVYQEAHIAFPDQVSKTLDEVVQFHRSLIENRILRLETEQKRLDLDRRQLAERIKVASKELDEVMQFLGTHGALDEFVALSEDLSRLQSRKTKLEEYDQLLTEYQKEAQKIRLRMSQQTIATTEYLEEAQPLLDNNMSRFRTLSRLFYGDRGSGLTVDCNEGDNETRYDIEAHIRADASDGINEVKIFCVDLVLLTERHGHHVEFVFHDSRLFSDVDVRQRSTMLKVAGEISREQGIQYIATLNHDQIDSMREEFPDDQFKELVEDAITLRLRDDSTESRLLGIDVDMRYD